MPPTTARTAGRSGDGRGVDRQALALEAAALGLAVFALEHGAKTPTKGSHGLKDATTDPERIRATIMNGQNYAILGGPDVLVLDCDDPDQVDVLEATFGELADAPAVRTPRGGRHWYLRADGWRMPTRAKAADGLDVRGFGRAYVVGPGSTVDGRTYEAVRPLVSPDQLPTVSAALREYLHPTPPPRRADPAPNRPPPVAGDRAARWAAAALEAEAGNVRNIAEGGRRDALNAAAFALGQIVGAGYLTDAEVAAELRAAVSTQRPPLPDAEAERTIADGIRDGRKNPRHPPEAPRAQAPTRPTSGADLPPEASSPPPPSNTDPDPTDADDPRRLPPGYRITDGCLVYAPERGHPRIVYAGHLEVIATGRTLDGDERLTVTFGVGATRRTITAPRGALVRARGVLDHLGAAGANVHDANARDVGRYLSEYSALNTDALPRLTLSDRLGITPGGIIGPGWQVGEHVTYSGPELHALRVRSDRDAYRDGLRTLASWEPSTWLPRAVLGLVAAGPHLEHLHLSRNPVLGIGAPSNIGKGTAVAFAFGLYADPGHPLAIQGIRTRTTALLQVFTQANGLPVWIDEAHKLDEQALVDGVYAFANRQTYARGGRDGTARGGDPLRGALILTGEGLVELTATGARNRVLIVDGLRHYPLGREKAPERVAALERARALGAGSVGQAVTGHLWEHRTTWAQDVHQVAGHLTSDAPTWHLAAAAAEVTLRYLYDALDLPADRGAEGLAQRMIAATTEGWSEVDPAREAFERVRDLVIAARGADGTRRARDGSALARVVGIEDGIAAWAVRSTAPEVEDMLKRYGGARVVAPLWRQRGYVRPDAQGKATRPAKLEPGEPAVRCYLFPLDLFDAAHDDAPGAGAKRDGSGDRPVN